jgi:hypothetical protein
MDSVARQHDVDYMRSAGSASGALLADIKAITHSYLNPSAQAFALRAGLGLRSFVNILTLGKFANFNHASSGLSNEQTQLLGEKLNNMIN